jgi:REP element-mobilizing transposase RayT
MVIAYHAIFSAYGFWLPNDPRGSWSDWVASWDLFKYGPATKTDARHSLAKNPHNRAFREQAKEGLKYPPVIFNGVQARAIGRGFAHAIQRLGYVIYACAIMPDHVHLVVARHKHRIEQVVQQMKGEATKQLIKEGLHPLAQFVRGDEKPATPWVSEGWNVYLDCAEDILRAIAYVEQNPLKERLPLQQWRSVTSWTNEN